MSQTSAAGARVVSRAPKRKSNLYQKRQRMALWTRIIAFLLAVFLVIPMVFADEEDDKASPLIETAVHMVATVAGINVEQQEGTGEGKDNPPVYELSTAGTGDNAAYTDNADQTLDDILSIDFQSETPVAAGGIDLSSVVGEDGIAHKIYQICEGVALALAIAIFCVSWMQAYLDGNVMEETWIRKFAIFGCSLAGIFFAQRLCLTIASVGSAVAHVVATTSSTGEAAAPALSVINEIAKDCYWGKGFMDTITSIPSWINAMVFKPVKYIIIMAVPFIAVYFANLIVYFTAWGRAIETFLVSAFSPFGMVNIERGFDGPMRFLKHVFALGIQGAIIMASLKICRQMQISAIASAFSNGTASLSAASFFSVIVIVMLQAGLVSRSRSIAQSVVS